MLPAAPNPLVVTNQVQWDPTVRWTIWTRYSDNPICRRQGPPECNPPAKTWTHVLVDANLFIPSSFCCCAFPILCNPFWFVRLKRSCRNCSWCTLHSISPDLALLVCKRAFTIVRIFFSYCVCVQEPCPRHNQDTVAKICMIQLGNFALLICEGARFSNACMDATTAFRTSGCSCITAGDPITCSSSSSLFPSNNAFDSSPSTASTKSLPVAIAPVSWHGKETRQSNAANVRPPLRLWMWTLFAEETIKA